MKVSGENLGAKRPTREGGPARPMWHPDSAIGYDHAHSTRNFTPGARLLPFVPGRFGHPAVRRQHILKKYGNAAHRAASMSHGTGSDEPSAGGLRASLYSLPWRGAHRCARLSVALIL